MQISSGKVVQGRVELDAELPEGASVTVIASDGDETFEVDAATEQKLLDAIAECERGETIPLERLLSEMRSRE
jgi:beta-lactam-binding protein with PASTA domain